jgi:hypothetical protein
MIVVKRTFNSKIGDSVMYRGARDFSNALNAKFCAAPIW